MLGGAPLYARRGHGPRLRLGAAQRAERRRASARGGAAARGRDEATPREDRDCEHDLAKAPLRQGVC